MMEIFWTMLASQDRKRIREYIAEQNMMAAIELDERIGYSASSLAGQPYNCRLYISDAADERSSVDIGGRRITNKQTQRKLQLRDYIIT